MSDAIKKEGASMQPKKCYESSKEGTCCCNCLRRVEIVKHPWNKGPFKGSVKEHLGWGCDALGPIVFSDRKHGMCEMYIRTI